MRLSSGVLVTACAVLIAACATAYGPQGTNPGYGGYVNKRIDDTHYLVRYDGNGHTEASRVWYFWIYRCAELTKEKGFDYFSVEPVKKQGGQAGEAGRSDSFRPTVFRPGQNKSLSVRPVYDIIVTTWHSAGIVTMYKDVPGDQVVMRAQSILDQLRPYVDSPYRVLPPSRNALLESSAYRLGPDGSPTRLVPDPAAPPVSSSDEKVL